MEKVKGKGLVQEREDSSKGIMGKDDKQPIKVSNGYVNKEATSLPGDHAA